MKTILWYLKAMKIVGIIYGGNEKEDLITKGYSNSDWIGDYTIRKSISDFIFILNKDVVS